MAEPYVDYQFRLEVCSPVAADSPFDSDTLWGRILSALVEGLRTEAALAKRWLDELKDAVNASNPEWNPPLLISDGFQCDVQGTPWLPIPLAAKLQLERSANLQGSINRKRIKEIDRLPFTVFSKVCQGVIPPANDLFALCSDEPSSKPVLHPHLAMNRASSTGIDGQFHMVAARTYSPPEIAFFIRLRYGEDSGPIERALQRVCREGWGKAKSRGLGQMRFKSFEVWQPPQLPEQAQAFVSLSYFCPAREDPTNGYWKLQAKHPVPTQFIEGRRVALGEESKWAVKSFLRLCAGSCFKFSDNESLRGHYGRMLTGLLDPALDGNGQQLPALFHYALAFPVPIKWPEGDMK